MLNKFKFSLPSLKLKTKLPKERYALGLDISVYSLKLVALRFFKDNTEVSGFSIEPAGLDVVPALKRMTANTEIKSVNISVSGAGSIIRYISFPQMNSGELKQALKFEAQKHIPFSIQEVYTDACILEENLGESKMLVLLAAAKKEMVNQRRKIIEEAGLKTNLVDLDSLALINAFNYTSAQENASAEQKAIALLNIGAHTSNLNIIEGRIPHLSRDIHIAGNSFTQSLADNLSLDFKSAENIKLNSLQDGLDKTERIMEPVLTNLANEIRVSFDYYESQSASSVSKIFLSGGGSKLLGLKETLANLLGIEVDYWDPLERLTISASVDVQRVKAAASQLAVAVGLAFRE